MKKNWGFCIFVLLSLTMYWRLLTQDRSEHYMTFITASHYLWSGKNPHVFDAQDNYLSWLYSPACGLFFFGLFKAFSIWVGLALYMLLDRKSTRLNSSH